MNSEILIDYLTISFKSNKIPFLIDYFHLPENQFEMGYGTLHYKHGLYIPGINLRWNEDIMGNITNTCIELSGKGCRLIEALNSEFQWLDLFDLLQFDLISSQCSISRIDIALDIKSHPVISAKLVQNYARAHLYVSKSKSLPLLKSERETTTYFGSNKSNRILRVYDKAQEQGIPDLNWTRFELQCRDDCAFSVVMAILGSREIGPAALGQISGFIRFVEPKLGYQDIIANNHAARDLETASWWLDILDQISATKKITRPKPEFTIENVIRYVEKQTAASLATYIIAHDGDPAALLDTASMAELKPRHKAALLQLQKEYNELNNIKE